MDTNLFAVLENDTLLTFIINKNNIHGTLIEPVKEMLSIEGIFIFIYILDLKQTVSQPAVVTILDRGVKPLSL
jgi:hypothetical protein